MGKATCSIEGCERPVCARGWCKKHWQVWSRHKDPLWERVVRLCSEPGCERKHYGNGLCMVHWLRVRRHGSTEKRERKITPAEERFWAKVDLNGPIPPHRPDLGPCWEWTGALDDKGYGRFNPGGGVVGAVFAHRWSWEQINGPVPDGLEVCHECDNPACVRAEVGGGHLRAETHAWNMADSKNKGRGRPFGHDTLQPCGTHAAYRRHLREKETPCDACREAAREYRREQYRKRRAT